MMTAWRLSWRASWQVWILEIISCQRRGSKQLLPGMDKMETHVSRQPAKPQEQQLNGQGKPGVVSQSWLLHKAQIYHKQAHAYYQCSLKGKLFSGALLTALLPLLGRTFPLSSIKPGPCSARSLLTVLIPQFYTEGLNSILIQRFSI